ncbi:hypothetical protein G9274_000536 [Stenotrophomonas rhizophila]|jgi:hypothetical protein|nr:hypothetical protein G9274_000536 [Stenotrophomonas rhizophila]
MDPTTSIQQLIEHFMNTQYRRFAFPLILASTFALAACSSNESEAPAAAEQAAAPADAPAAAASQNKPLTQEEVSIAIEQVGQATYNAADDTLTVAFKVTNNGKVALPANGGQNVSAGVLQLVPDPANPEGKRGQDIGRAVLNGDLQVGQSQELKASVPAALLVGNKLQVELLQEAVAWFGFNFQQPVLVLGPFARCADGKGLCDDKGAPITAATP